jgi:hypothetical protein
LDRYTRSCYARSEFNFAECAMVEKSESSLIADDDSDKFRESRRSSAALPSIYVDTWFFSRFSGMFRISMGETFNKLISTCVCLGRKSSKAISLCDPRYAEREGSGSRRGRHRLAKPPHRTFRKNLLWTLLNPNLAERGRRRLSRNGPAKIDLRAQNQRSNRYPRSLLMWSTSRVSASLC